MSRTARCSVSPFRCFRRSVWWWVTPCSPRCVLHVMSTCGASTSAWPPIMGASPKPSRLPPMESPSFDEVKPVEQPEESFIGPLFDGVQAREWALVLQSQSIAYVMRNVGDGWILLVPPNEYERALDA